MAKKKTPLKPQMKPKAAATTQPSNNMPYILVAVGLTVLVGYVAWQVYQPQELDNKASSKVSGGYAPKEIVARTEPEIGETLTTSIIKTQADGAVETSITVYPPKPKVVDITAELKEPLSTAPNALTNNQTLSKDVQQANIARATLELAKQLQVAPATQTAPNNKAFMVLALYSALNTGAPETMALAIQIGAEDLSTSLAQYGPLTLADVLLHADINTVEIQRTPQTEDDVALPSWWQRTLGQFIQVTKTEKTAVTPPHKTALASKNDKLPNLLKQGEWHMAEQEIIHIPDGAYKTLARAYIAQRKAMAQLLGKTLEVQ